LAALHLAALQWANSGNNMTVRAFQFFLPPAVAALHAIALLLSNVRILAEIPDSNLTLAGQFWAE